MPSTSHTDNLLTAGGLAVYGAYALPGVRPVVAELLDEEVPQRLARKDASLWGADVISDAAIRLGWIDTVARTRELLPRLVKLRDELRAEGLVNVVLCGMGGSSLAPEVICRTLGADLTVLDTTDPGQISRALDSLLTTIVVVSSKSGSTIETDSHRRLFFQAFLDAGLSREEAGRRFVIVTDPGSPLADIGHEMNTRDVFLADENVGGRYSALTAFGTVPAVLAGVDISPILDEAHRLAATLEDENPALALGTALGVAAAAGRNSVVIASDGSGIVGLGDWIEQLLAESTGKDGSGILPVVVDNVIDVKTNPDRLVASVGGALSADTVPSSNVDIAVSGGLGAQFLAWEYATAIVGRLLQINPFNQPNVAESKANTAQILDKGFPSETPAFTEGAIVVYADPSLLAGADNVRNVLQMLLSSAEPEGYIAVMAYLDRVADSSAAELGGVLQARTSRPVTFGWGPRFLHSTGQYHKGGPATGSFLQITGDCVADLPIPGQSYSFGTLQAAQAAGDRLALTERGRPMLHLHLTQRAAGIAQLLEAAQ